MEIECPKCGARYDVKKSDIGNYAECECGNRFVMKEIRSDYVFRTSAWHYFASFFIAGVFILSGILAIIGIVMILVLLIKIFTTKYTLTDKKIIKETGLLNKRKTSIFLSDIRNVDISSSLMQRSAGIGNLNISTAGNSGYEMSLIGIKDPEHVLSLIDSGHK